MTRIIRISRPVMFMEMALTASKRSTCMRRAVGAIVVVDNRVVSIGWNGAPAGQPHCDGLTCVPQGQTGCTRVIHAEVNAVAYVPAQFNHVSKTMYTTESPCLTCATILQNNNFSSIYYLNEYRLDHGIKYLLKEGTQVFRMTLAGLIMRKSLEDVGAQLLLTETIIGETDDKEAKEDRRSVRSSDVPKDKAKS
jgi:dCMP deaminase